MVVQLAARGKVFKCCPRLEFSSLNNKPINVILEKLISTKTKGLHQVFGWKLAGNCFEAGFCKETTWIMICYWLVKISTCLKLARLQKRLHIPGLDDTVAVMITNLHC